MNSITIQVNKNITLQKQTHPPRKAPTGFLAGSGEDSQRGRETEKGRTKTRPLSGRKSFDRTVMLTSDLLSLDTVHRKKRGELLRASLIFSGERRKQGKVTLGNGSAGGVGNSASIHFPYKLDCLIYNHNDRE